MSNPSKTNPLIEFVRALARRQARIDFGDQHHETEEHLTTKKMEVADIPAFVEAVTATGCNITAIGPTFYVLGDGDPPESRRDEVWPLSERLSEEMGKREHLRNQIVAYLHSIGRSVPSPQKQ